jgi:hypothetical protein
MPGRKKNNNKKYIHRNYLRYVYTLNIVGGGTKTKDQ